AGLLHGGVGHRCPVAGVRRAPPGGGSRRLRPARQEVRGDRGRAREPGARRRRRDLRPGPAVARPMAGMRFRTVFGTLIVLAIGMVVILDSSLFTVYRPLGSILLTLFGLVGWKEFAAITGIRGPGPKSS